jgi:hypothetical protein
MVLDAAKVQPDLHRWRGGGLGSTGLSGVAVAFVTYAKPGYPSSNFFGISTGGSGQLTLVSTATNIPNLRTTTHAVQVTADSSGNLIVKMDGVQVLNTPVSLPTNALVGFSGATGGATDIHAVSGINITY